MGHRILLADDSLTIRKVVELTFAGAEWDLRAVGSGDKAVGLLADFEPDLVLADAVMPGLSGYELCEAVKKLPYGAYIPVVMLTGTFEPFDRPRADRAGADTVVSKPFDSHALSSLVRDLVVSAKEARAVAPPPPPPPPPQPEPEPEALAPEPEAPVPEFAVTAPVAELEAPPEPGEETSPTNVVLVTPPAVAEAEIPPEPFREAELPLLPAGEVQPSGWEVDLGGLEDDIPRRDVEADIEQYERRFRGSAERPVFSLPADELEGGATSVELPPRGGPLLEPPPSELETLAASASLTDLTRIVGASPVLDRPLSEDDVERVARRVVEILGERVVRKVAWDVVPEMAERLVRERLRELERAD